LIGLFFFLKNDLLFFFLKIADPKIIVINYIT
jgi:hypothetical protein